jgi:hypothetical protein
MGKLEELLACPVDWKAKLDTDDWYMRMPHLDWYYSFAQHAVDGEDLPLYPDEFDDVNSDPVELKSLVINLEMRRDEAEKLYMTRAGRLGGLKFLRPAEHGKHFAAWMSEADSVSQSKTGISYPFKNYASDRMEKAFWWWFCFCFEDVNDYMEYEDLLDPETERYKMPDSVLWRRFLEDTNVRIC